VSDTIRAERRGDVYAITLNRPDTGNAVSDATIVELGDLLAGVDPAVRVITLQGAGADFCVGREPPPPGVPRQAMEAIELRRAHDIVFRTYGLIRGTRAPVVAAVRGRALGFGFALAAVADITLAAEDATFQIPEFAHAIMPTMVMSALIDRVALKPLMYRVYSTEPFSAAEALQMGAVSALVPAAELDGALATYVERLLAAPPPALLAVKDYARNAQAIDINKAVEYARALHAVINTAGEMRRR
jgi:enoyl-CoA hydratase/carnithine racemase